ncbi:hypothetical protein glysoja_020314, partial [Glycine soja]
PPPYDFVKCNTDASIFQDQSKFGLATSVQDTDGTFISVMSSWFSGIPSPLEAEARSLQLALDWQSSQKQNNLILETDCKQIINCIKAKKFQNNEVGDILRNCVEKISTFQNCIVQFVTQQANQVVHSLARASRSFACLQLFD